MKTLSKIALFNCLCLGIAYSSNQDNQKQDPFAACLNALKVAAQSSIQDLKQRMDQTISRKEATISEKETVIVKLQKLIQEQEKQYGAILQQQQKTIDNLEKYKGSLWKEYEQDNEALVEQLKRLADLNDTLSETPTTHDLPQDKQKKIECSFSIIYPNSKKSLALLQQEIDTLEKNVKQQKEAGDLGWRRYYEEGQEVQRLRNENYELRKLENELAGYENYRNNTNRKINDLQQELERTRQEAQNFRKKFCESESERKDAESTIKSLRAYNQRLFDMWETAQKVLENSESDPGDIKSLLESICAVLGELRDQDPWL